MLPDHYATLGIAPNSRPAAIRAAYVELMRRYHPDLNSSAADAARVRSITAAYSILGVPDRRAAYDLKRARLVAAEDPVSMPERPQWRPFLGAAFGLALIVLLLPLLVPPPSNPPERSDSISSGGGRKQAVPLKQDQTATSWNPGPLGAAEGISDMLSLSNEAPSVSPLAAVAPIPEQVTDQLDTPAAPKQGARNKRAEVVEQKSVPAQPPEAAVAHAQAIQPRPEPPQPRPAAPTGRAGPAAGADQAPPAWQQPIKPAWQQPLPQAKD